MYVFYCGLHFFVCDGEGGGRFVVYNPLLDLRRLQELVESVERRRRELRAQTAFEVRPGGRELGEDGVRRGVEVDDPLWEEQDVAPGDGLVLQAHPSSKPKHAFWLDPL